MLNSKELFSFELTLLHYIPVSSEIIINQYVYTQSFRFETSVAFLCVLRGLRGGGGAAISLGIKVSREEN